MNAPTAQEGILADLQRTVATLNSLSPHQIEHLQSVVEVIIECFVNPDAHAMLLFERPTAPGSAEHALQYFAINANDFEAAKMLTAADHYINFRVLDGAPPKEAFN